MKKLIKKCLPGDELDWSPESWFSKRVAKPDGTKYTEDDAKALASHVPEYRQIEKDTKANGTWLKMEDGSTWEGDPRAWIMMLSKAYKQNYDSKPWWTGQARWETKLETPDGIATDKVMRAPYHNGEMWFSDNKDYGDGFAHAVDRNGLYTRFYNGIVDRKYSSTGKYLGSEIIEEDIDANVKGVNFLSAIPKKGNYRYLESPGKGKEDDWRYMPFRLKDNQIIRLSEDLFKNAKEKILTDDVVKWSKDLGDEGIFMYNVLDGPTLYTYEYEDGTEGLWDPAKRPIDARGNLELPINEFISQPGFTNKVKFIEGNNGNFDINNPYKYSDNRKRKNPNLARRGSKLIKRIL